LRKQKDVTITQEGRDNGKTFRITEMPALKAEKWATRALLAVARSGVDIGDIENAGMHGLARLGIQALTKLNYYDIEPLLDEMLECISIKEKVTARDLTEDDIEEAATYLVLRKEVLDLHMGFSRNATQSMSTSVMASPESIPSNTPTSHDPSVRFSRSPRTKPQR
jgi:hypothetical protein